METDRVDCNRQVTKNFKNLILSNLIKIRHSNQAIFFTSTSKITCFNPQEVESYTFLEAQRQVSAEIAFYVEVCNGLINKLKTRFFIGPYLGHWLSIAF